MTSSNSRGMADRTSSHEERFTKIDDLLREYEKANLNTPPTTPRYQPTKYRHKPKEMSHSLSENNVSFRLNRGHNNVVSGSPQLQRDNRYDAASKNFNDDSETTPVTHTRGRGLNRTPSPVKGLEDIKEDQSPEGNHDHSTHKPLPAFPPASPTKRSRSPIKQLFGEKGFLGRTTSMNELPSEEYRKRGVWHLGEKFKHRVEGMVDCPAAPRS